VNELATNRVVTCIPAFSKKELRAAALRCILRENVAASFLISVSKSPHRFSKCKALFSVSSRIVSSSASCFSKVTACSVARACVASRFAFAVTTASFRHAVNELATNRVVTCIPAFSKKELRAAALRCILRENVAASFLISVSKSPHRFSKCKALFSVSSRIVSSSASCFSKVTACSVARACVVSASAARATASSLASLSFAATPSKTAFRRFISSAAFASANRSAS